MTGGFMQTWVDVLDAVARMAARLLPEFPPTPDACSAARSAAALLADKGCPPPDVVQSGGWSEPGCVIFCWTGRGHTVTLGPTGGAVTRSFRPDGFRTPPVPGVWPPGGTEP